MAAWSLTPAILPRARPESPSPLRALRSTGAMSADRSRSPRRPAAGADEAIVRMFAAWGGLQV
eukprot:6866153-Pyramimonas_sp.AAC.1